MGFRIAVLAACAWGLFCVFAQRPGEVPEMALPEGNASDQVTADPTTQRMQLEPLLLELQAQVQLNFSEEFPDALRDDLKEELALSLEALVMEVYGQD